MTTSLSQQLNQLKIKQKDEIEVPTRTKISFLFDIKRAANIDDQTLYFLCLGAINETKQEAPELHANLEPYMEDIFHENSVSFYRGTQTKEQLKIVDDKLDALLSQVLPPYYLNVSQTHKIVEYLLRIYDVHAHHKNALVFGWLPLFETSYFLKISQLVRTKDDKWLDWLADFAYKGEQVPKLILLKVMHRNKAGLFD